MGRRAAVVGATGLVGGELVKALVADEAYDRVIVLARRPISITHPKIEARIVQFDALEETKLEVDDAYCALGTTIKTAGSKEAFRRVDHDYPLAFAKAVKSHAESYGLVSALGADKGSVLFYNRVKGEAEADVEALGFRTFAAFRPSFLDGQRTESRLGERAGIAVAKVAGLLPFAAVRRARPILASDVAKAMIAVAKERRPGARVVLSDEIFEIAKSSA